MTNSWPLTSLHACICDVFHWGFKRVKLRSQSTRNRILPRPWSFNRVNYFGYIPYAEQYRLYAWMRECCRRCPEMEKTVMKQSESTRDDEFVAVDVVKWMHLRCVTLGFPWREVIRVYPFSEERWRLHACIRECCRGCS